MLQIRTEFRFGLLVFFSFSIINTKLDEAKSSEFDDIIGGDAKSGEGEIAPSKVVTGNKTSSVD